MLEQSKHITLKIGDSTIVDLDNRGALGLQLNYDITPPDYVIITNIENRKNDNDKTVGAAIRSTFSIKAVKKGRCVVQFFESQVWNKEFEAISLMRVFVEIVD
jgi:predicted secreted protein